MCSWATNLQELSHDWDILILHIYISRCKLPDGGVEVPQLSGKLRNWEPLEVVWENAIQDAHKTTQPDTLLGCMN